MQYTEFPGAGHFKGINPKTTKTTHTERIALRGVMVSPDKDWRPWTGLILVRNPFVFFTALKILLPTTVTTSTNATEASYIVLSLQPPQPPQRVEESQEEE